MSQDPKVAILLATQNGAAFLQEQLESYRNQTYRNWELFVSDDGSTDGTVDLVEAFAKSVQQRVVVLQGPGEGFWQNFAALVRNPDIRAEFVAYSDQDDVWFAEKLERAVRWFTSQPDDRPNLYFTRTELVAADGAPIGFSPLFVRAPTFQNALVQNIGGGNTMVFNRPAHLALLAMPQSAEIVSHDWWTYQVVTAIGGLAHYDPWPSIKYRQHGQNIVGSNRGLRARLVRIALLINGRAVKWNNVNIKALNTIKQTFTPANRSTLDHFSAARSSSLFGRIGLLRKSGVYRQGVVENIGMVAGALLGRF